MSILDRWLLGSITLRVKSSTSAGPRISRFHGGTPGTPSELAGWMVYFMENPPPKMDDFRVPKMDG